MGEGSDASIDRLAPEHTVDPCVTPSATATQRPTITPTSTPTPTERVAQLPATGQGGDGATDSGARTILLAAASLVLLATALLSIRRKPT